MIGVFDSGYGGLPTMRALSEALPQYDYVYLGDHARAPYGPRSKEEIYQFSLDGVRELFRRGCEVIIFACNTAAANALREIQQNVLPKEFPGKRVLGILSPTVEQLTSSSPSPYEGEGRGEVSTIGILATEATVRSGAYTREIQKVRPDVTVVEQACPLLTPMIENDAPADEIGRVAKECLDALMAKGKIDAVLLGCTHYELIQGTIAQMLPNGVKLYAQSGIVAASFRDYLHRHPERETTLAKNGRRQFLTTGDAAEVSRLGSRFYGEPIQFDHITLNT